MRTTERERKDLKQQLSASVASLGSGYQPESMVFADSLCADLEETLAENARLQEQAKIGREHVQWSEDSQRVLNRMCEVYGEGKREVRRLQERVEEQDRERKAQVESWRMACDAAEGFACDLVQAREDCDEARALAERRKEALATLTDAVMQHLGGEPLERTCSCPLADVLVALPEEAWDVWRQTQLARAAIEEEGKR